MNYEEILELIKKAELKVSTMILEATNILSTDKTDSRNVVTKYDEAVQAKLVDIISKEIPGAHFFCEESAHPDTLDAEHVFIIDPIDGTMNFVHGMNCSCISVAYMHNGVLTAGAVYQPFSKELFEALKGHGAYLNGRKISVDDVGMGKGIALLGTAPYFAERTDYTFKIARMLYDNCLDIRRSGSAAIDICTVAAGRAVIYYEAGLSLWDCAAGALIVEEAGGVIFTHEGKSLPLDGSKLGIVCGGAIAVKEFFEREQRLLRE